MIRSIYVKSYMLPDVKSESKRKTEEQRIEKSDVNRVKKKGQDRIANFQAGCFVFTRPLVYQNISGMSIKSKTLRLEVCVTQKYTRKSFCIATHSIPMAVACKKLLKEKYTLTACSSLTLPENMKVYSATQLSGSDLQVHELQCPSHHTSQKSWATPYEDSLSTSPSDLQSVRSGSSQRSVTIEVTESDDDDAELQSALQQIAVVETRQQHNRPGNVVLSFEDNATEDEDGFEVCTHLPISSVDVQVHIPREKHTRSHQKTRAKDCRAENEESVIIDGFQTDALQKRQSKKARRQRPQLDEEMLVGSHGDTPAWDYYSEPLSFQTKCSAEDELDWDGSPCLPVATTLQLPGASLSDRPKFKET